MILAANSINCHKCGKPTAKTGIFCLHCGASTNPVRPNSAQDPYLGQVIDGSFVVESILGEGSMGIVYKARHRALKSYVALKILRHDFLNNRVVLSRFQREAQAASSLQHPNVVSILHYGKTFLNAPYIAMECLEGQDLSDVILNEFPLSAARATKILIQVCDALEAAHAAGIVHRDLKPANISIIKHGNEDFVKVLDFGIAKLEGSSENLTREGAIFGTPAFMSPEQVLGKVVTAASDIFSLGSVIYFMLTARLPFSGENSVDMAASILYSTPLLPSRVRLDAHVAPEIEEICMRSLQKEPEDRYASAGEIRDALQSALPSILAQPKQGRRQSIMIGAPASADFDLSGDTVCEIPAMTDEIEKSIPHNIGFSPPSTPALPPAFVATSLGLSDLEHARSDALNANKRSRLKFVFVSTIIICICLLAVLTTWLTLRLQDKKKVSQAKTTNHLAARVEQDISSDLVKIDLALPPIELEILSDNAVNAATHGFLLGSMESHAELKLEKFNSSTEQAPPTPAPVKAAPKTPSPSKAKAAPAKAKAAPTKTKTAPVKAKPAPTQVKAAAPSTDSAKKANELYQEGLKLESNNRKADACKKFKQALKIAPSSDKLKIQLKVRTCTRESL
ncbi:MAG: serine/threonine-protein kinase [Bradymonadales bacterium]